jgi:hypothetical protein
MHAATQQTRPWLEKQFRGRHAVPCELDVLLRYLTIEPLWRHTDLQSIGVQVRQKARELTGSRLLE